MKRKAFTLIELLIVIAIIGVLAAALYPTIRDALSRGRDAAREGDINNIITALETYNADYGMYPAGADCVSAVFVAPGTTDSVVSEYFKGGGVPMDPSPNRNIPSGLTDPGGCVAGGEYYYEYIGANGLEYEIATIMETENNNNTSTDPVGYTGAAALADGEDYYVKLI